MLVYIVGQLNAFSLETSYANALRDRGVQVRTFDIVEQQQSFSKLGKLGRLFHDFVPIDAWQRKVNRKLALDIVAHQPDVVLVFCNAPVLLGTLAFVRSLTMIPFVLVWPDPLLNLKAHLAQAACLYDGVATYSRATVPVFERMGFRNVCWVPLAADHTLHGIDTRPASYTYDLAFAGAWRPERETALVQIRQLFPTLKLGIFGPNWDRCTSSALRSIIHKKPLLGRSYAQVFNSSQINLNVIDDTCLPAANMRFFEIPVAHGLQLASPCPEFSDTYLHHEHILYFANPDELAEGIEWVMQHPKQANLLREAAYQQTVSVNTYKNRVDQVLTFTSPVH